MLQIQQIENAANNQIGIIQLNEHSLNVYGTIDDPLVKCSDLLIHVLGYRDCNTAKWFRIMQQNPRYVQPGHLAGCQMFTEFGIYQAFMKSNKPIAEQFQYLIQDWIKQQRLRCVEQHKNQIEQRDRQIEEFKQNMRVGYIYKYTHKIYKTVDYVGQTEIGLTERNSSHIQNAKTNQIPFYKSIFIQGINRLYDQELIEEVKFNDKKELFDREHYWQLHYRSLFNMPKLICSLCDKQYSSKSIKKFEDHRAQCYEQQ